MHRRVFLITESDEYLIGTVGNILRNRIFRDRYQRVKMEDSGLGVDASFVIREIVDEMVFGDHECNTDSEKQISIVIR